MATLRKIASVYATTRFFPISAQQCYYPNGDAVTAEPVAPCYSWGGACCPVSWTCLSNNLCAYGNQTGRYSCVDQDWGNSCPNFCRNENGSAGGNQAIQSCGGGKYCCNGRGLDTDQCCETGTALFTPGAGTPVSTIVGAASTDASLSSTKSTLTTRATSTTKAHTTTKIQTTQSVVSSGGQAKTVQVTVVSTSLVTPTSSADPVAATAAGSSSSGSDSSSDGGSILPKAIGIPVGVISALVVGALIYLAARHMRKRKARIAQAKANEDALKEDGGTTGPNSPLRPGEFIGSSPLRSQVSDDMAFKEQGGAGNHRPTMSELSGTEVLQLHEEPQIAELPAEGSGKG